jgi:WD repeat-containing protein 35
MNIQCLPSGAAGEAQVVVLDWYNGNHGYIEADCPTLVICYDIGRMQIMRNENDDSE